MKKDNVVQFEGRDVNSDLLTQLLQTGARQLLAQAIEAEVSEFLTQFQGRTLDNGRAAVVRNGHQPERDIQTGIGPVTVKVPKVRARDGEPVTFRSALVPPYVRRTKTIEAALPWLYLKGIPSGEMQNALEVLVGPEAKGLAANTISFHRLSVTKHDAAHDVQAGALCGEALAQTQGL